MQDAFLLIMLDTINGLIINTIVDNYNSISWLSPILVIGSTMLVNLSIQLLIKRNNQYRWLQLSTVIGLVAASYFTLKINKKIPTKEDLYLFNYLLYLNSSAVFSHIILLGATIFILILPIYSDKLNHQLEDIGVYFFMILTILLGSILLVMSHHWIIMYLSLTCMSIGSTVLVNMYGTTPYQKNTLSSTRYLIYSMVAGSLMLVGMSYIYGSVGKLGFNNMLIAKQNFSYFSFFILCIGFSLSLSGLWMAIGSFPFQFWVAGVYQNTSLNIVAYISTIPKVAVIVLIGRLHQVLSVWCPSLYNISYDLWCVIAITTMLIGHISALVTNDVRKLLAFGTIAQTGFLLVMVIIIPPNKYVHLAYYITVYALVNLTSWIGLQSLIHFAGKFHIKYYAGLGKNIPIIGACFLVSMLALAGLPPTVGFPAKLLVLSKLWERAQATKDILFTVLWTVSVLGTIFSLYYYLRIPYILFFKDSKSQVVRSTNRYTQLILLLLTGFMIGLFLFTKSFIALF